MKTFLTSEDLFHYVEIEPQLDGLAGTPVGSSTATPTIGSVTGFGNRKPNAKARHYIMMYIDEDDQDIVMFEEDAKNIWNKLKDKYKERLQTTNRQFVQDYMTNTKPVDKTIREAWLEIIKLARKVHNYQPELEKLVTKEYRFQILLRSLPGEYIVIRDTLDAQVNLHTDIALQKLEEKEAQLHKDTETGMWAGQKDRRPNQSGSRWAPDDSRSAYSEGSKPSSSRYRKNSSDSDSDHRSNRFKSSCLFCRSKDHFAKQCPDYKAFRQFQLFQKAQGQAKSKPKDPREKKKHRA
ncbi:MAG: hypothetical protein Q9228_000267 [Teloschistes exilis]